ncbi:putative disease resistance RPP13-like protein 3 [Camellia lanceoleosa]|uniref:Disease resistance RPP13-like protein 3 n=1 Tax=Camellia lanceoleosa TaxID=1840588 RepID=A0ACC0HHZ2_9ERIC|nr:putative disease resistance RPP13-like protein 3 [Camellia lanceoleosa]
MEGIAVTVALSLVEKVLSSLDRVPSQKNLRDQVEEVTNSLRTMQAYLRDMEGREGRSWMLKERMKQVRDIAYDTENVLDEIMLHVTYRYHRHRITKKTHELFHNLAHWIPLHNTMSSKMEGIKERIVGITASDQLGGGGGGDGGGSSLCVCSEGPNSRPKVEHCDDVVSLQQQHGNEDEIVGFEKPTQELLCQLSGTEPRQKTMIISVVGPCGSGKSHLAKNVYGITRSHELFDCYAWKSEEENLVSVLAKTADTRSSEKFRRLSIHNPSCIKQISTVFRSNSVLSSSVRSTFFFKMDKLSEPSDAHGVHQWTSKG